MGLYMGTVLVVVHTQRGNNIRIISARKANRKEKQVFYEAI
ncbi:MAG: BrnT family toxin [Rhodothermales bacterium]